MGMKYANILLRFRDQKAVAALLSEDGWKAYVTPPRKGYLVVFEEKSAELDPEAISELTKVLSSSFNCPALGVLNFDDDIFWYTLYSRGKFLDEFSSDPGITTQPKTLRLFKTNHGKRLCEAFDQLEKLTRVEEILTSKENKVYFSQSDRHLDLAKALGWPTGYILLSYSEFYEADETKDSQAFTARSLSRKWLRQFTKSDVGQPYDLNKEVRKLIRQKRFISAMTLYQQQSGCSLREAEDYVKKISSW